MTIPRTPEPELMDAPEQARAYAEADFSAPNQLFSETVARQLTGRHSGTLIDLGCGPGDICIRLAHLLPGWQIVGLDAGPNMLTLASAAVESQGLAERIELIQAHLPDELPAGHFDAIVSNSVLHHLPDPSSLWQAITLLAQPGCEVMVMDLHRPESLAAAQAIVDEHASDAPAVLREDFYNSLLAAWTEAEIRQQLEKHGLSHLQFSRPSDRHWMVQGQIRGHT